MGCFGIVLGYFGKLLGYFGIQCAWPSVRVRVALGLLDVHAEFVLLVTAHVGVAHEEQRVVLGARGRRHEIQLHLGTRGHGVTGVT